MKTLVLHPKDGTTEFLTEIYKNQKDFTVVTDRPSKSKIKQLLKDHDRIIILGHGTEKGVFEPETFYPIIDSTLVYLLREKICICIWCNADQFVEKYNLKGFYTGMFISDTMEANMECIDATYSEVEYSNKLFATTVGIGLFETNNTEELLEFTNKYYLRPNDGYVNHVLNFNKERLYNR